MFLISGVLDVTSEDEMLESNFIRLNYADDEYKNKFLCLTVIW